MVCHSPLSRWQHRRPTPSPPPATGLPRAAVCLPPAAVRQLAKTLLPVAVAMLSVMTALSTCRLAGAQERPPTTATASSPHDAGSLAEEIGSLRNATVAFTQPTPPQTLTFFAGAIDAETQRELQTIAPHVRLVTGLSPAEALARAEEAHGVDARFATPAFLEKATQLAWVQAMHAGVERLVNIPRLAENDSIVLTNFRGVHGPAIADHAMAMLLSVTRQLPHYSAADSSRRGAPSGRYSRPIALQDKTMLVVGLGGIGSEIAQRAHGFGMRVIGVRRSDAPNPDYIAKVGKPDELMALLPEADVVAIAVPLTEETHGLFDDKLFAAMKPGTYLINIARGQIVDTEAMMRALESGQLAAACLDVTDPEPLPADHPLRRWDNVIVTPHMAGMSQTTSARGAALLRENLRRFSQGEPLLNVVDKAVGY